MNFLDFLKSRPLVLDGAMGTELQARGLKPGEIPEEWNCSHAADVCAIHEAYLTAGSDAILANTFGANREKFHGSVPLEKVIASALSNARSACAHVGGTHFVALDVGPTGRLLKPAGDTDFDAVYEAFAEQVRLGAQAGADFVFIETMSDTYELKAAVLAAKENCSLPILATVALGTDGRLLTGATPEVVATLLDGLRVDAMGFNCGLGPDLLLPYVKRLVEITSRPVIVKPNAGLPQVVEGQTRFLVGPDAFARDVEALVEAGACVVGGCCGTTPAHIRAVREMLNTKKQGLSPRTVVPQTRISSYAQTVTISLTDSVMIGERINPTGKKKLKEAYQTGDTAYILREAIAQTEAGAPILDVNAGVPGIDEVRVLDQTVQAIQSVTDVPLQIDTSSPQALERALRHYNGKALINSVNGKEEVMAAVFPLVAKYGGVVVALTLDEKGIPSTADARVELARKIIARGATYGLTTKDFLIDVLCLAVSAEPTSAGTILEAIRRVKTELGCGTVLGVSNISFGLPLRPALNATFYTLALEAGLSAAIVNPLSVEMRSSYHAWRALTARDAQCLTWIKESQNLTPPKMESLSPQKRAGLSSPKEEGLSPLISAIVHGLQGDAGSFTRGLLESGQKPVDVVNQEIVPALEIVGKGFEKGTTYLPQLLMAAEAARAAFDVVRKELEKSGTAKALRGPIIMATVKGDIHDIGKNIVRALLENYGFEVVDLGRDVPPERIVETAQKIHCRLVGLSALMTTTVGFMEETIRQLKMTCPACATMVGGAVITSEFAHQIGATYYGKDAMASVRIAEEVFGVASKDASC